LSPCGGAGEESPPFGPRDLAARFSNPKSEYRNPKQIQNSKSKIQNKEKAAGGFGHFFFEF
jgi:hypothetical protein